MGTCTDCGHRAAERIPARLTVALAHRLGLRPPRARCRVMLDSVESGVGMPGECWCGHPFHGS